MRDIKNKLTTGKNTKTIQQRRAKGFGYQVLGFGAGGSGPPFVEASGGTITTTGDYKIHTFASPGTFTVTNAGSATEGIVDYFVVAGGGGGGNNGYPQQRAGGAGGGGGFRLSNATAQVAAPVMSPLSAPAGLNVTAQGYPITVGAGGVGGQPATNSGAFQGFIGASSIFSSITSTGGGGGGGHPLISGGPSPVPGGPHDGGSGASDVSPGRRKYSSYKSPSRKQWWKRCCSTPSNFLCRRRRWRRRRWRKLKWSEWRKWWNRKFCSRCSRFSYAYSLWNSGSCWKYKILFWRWRRN